MEDFAKRKLELITPIQLAGAEKFNL